MFETLILFDESLPAPSIYTIFIYTIGILIASNLIFILLCALMGVNSNKTLDKEKDKEFKEWKKKNISPWGLATGEILNSTLYAPLAEELTFRLVLMKYVAVKGMKLNKWTANAIQAVLFGLIHLTNSIYGTQTKDYTYLQTLSATISGLISGWAYFTCNSILPSLLAHMINNGIAGITELIGYIKFLRKT